MYHHDVNQTNLKVCNERESQGSTPACQERESVDDCEPGLDLVGAAVLQDLFVSDVETDCQQERPQVDQLAEYTALRWSGRGVTDVRPVQRGVVQGDTAVMISVIVLG